MPDNIMQIAVFAFVAILAVISIILVLAYRYKKKTERQLRDMFGKPTQKTGEDLSYLTSYHTYFSKSNNSDKTIDNITWDDLNMDDVFQRINVCNSSVGEEYLYHILHDLKSDASDIEKREQIVKWMDEHPDYRLRIQQILRGMGKRKNNGLSAFLFYARTKQLAQSWIYILMALLPIATITIAFFSVKIAVLSTAFAVIANIYIYSRKRMVLEGEIETLQYFSSLLYCVKNINRKYGEKLKLLGLDLTAAMKPFNNLGGVLPGTTQAVTSELESFILLFKMIFLIDLILYNRTIRFFIRYTSELKELYQIIGELDSCICIASYRKSIKSFCIPEFHDNNTICFSEVYHPLIKSPVKNSGFIDNDSIITGSNASGKSTFIKTIAVNNILAQTINTCCADKYVLCFSYVASSMAISDNILSGDSYFIAEIKSLKRIIKNCEKKRCVCFIDEILRGTNTPERIAASSAILKFLHDTDSLCIVASHDIELTELLKDYYDNYHFSEEFINDNIKFDYLLKKGTSNSTNAIKLLKIMGFNNSIVDEALSVIKKDKN